MYEVNYYDVEFYVDETLLKKESVAYLHNATPPKDPKKEGHTFTGWSKSYEAVKGNVDTHALFERNKYLVRFFVDDVLYSEMEVLYGDGPGLILEPYKEGYNFMGWDRDITTILKDIDVHAIFQLKEYTVVFKDYYNRVIVSSTVKHGEAAIAPTAPELDHHIFKGWDQTFDHVISDMVVKALYEKDPYAIDITTLMGSKLMWTPVEGVSKYNIQIGEARTVSLKPEVDLGFNGIAHISNHTKVIVTDETDTFKGVIYLNRLGNERYEVSTKEAPLLDTPTDFIIEEGKYLTFPRVKNDCESWSTPSYVLYYNYQGSAIQTSVAPANTRVSYNLGALVWHVQPQIIKIVLIGYGTYGNAIAASIHINRLDDGTFTIIKVE